jgi:hypothetical protein
MSRQVTELDLRMPEFRGSHINPDDFEFRADGKIVRKDRWRAAMFEIASILGMDSREGFEINEVVERIQQLARDEDDHAEAPKG